MPAKILSVKNERIKAVVRLRDRDERDKTGLTIVEGRREIARALEAHCRFQEFYFCPKFLVADDASLMKTIHALKIPVYESAEDVFKKIAYGERKEGVLGVCAPQQSSLEDLKNRKDLFLLVVEAVEKPGNLGAILRTCDGAGVDGIIVCDEKTDIFNPNVIRASLGTVFSNRVMTGSSKEVFRYLQSQNIKVCAATPAARDVYSDINFKGPLAIVVGSEEKGLSDFWMSRADFKIKIPMKGKADSLNVSTSAAILLYEALRQRNT
ncbi:MAG: RNA methyltransferase [Candidatus Omnitrophica bacterium]|nr:RNA methyltransferase [Candidatus Omnitrophota bacterium]